MFDLFKDNQKDHNNNLYINIGALLIHVAKIDENYSEKEKEIIKKTLLELGLLDEALDNIFKKSEEAEKNSNQILEFTKEIKNKDEEFKVKIVEALWKIIYADNVSDMYEMSLMRRLTGLLYLDAKTVGDIKNRIKNS
tara:strand:- start:316 stop:729 length:414 start_codon:yes stop_codon:yes gene_type:complete